MGRIRTKNYPEFTGNLCPVCENPVPYNPYMTAAANKRKVYCCKDCMYIGRAVVYAQNKSDSVKADLQLQFISGKIPNPKLDSVLSKQSNIAF